MTEHTKPLIFQIGFNKCATSAFFFLFLNSGYKALHSRGTYWQKRDHPLIKGRSAQRMIAANIAKGAPPLGELIAFDAFFDMELSVDWPRIENFKSFQPIAEAYPNARFILNTRNEEAWLTSRMRHGDGNYAARAMEATGLDRDGLRAAWLAEYRDHNAGVRAYFADQPARLCDFDTDADAVTKLIDFAAPDFALDATHWRRVRVTDQVAKRKNWSR